MTPTTETTTTTTTKTDIKTPETARAVRARCEAAGLPEALTERAVLLGAPARHEARVLATLSALEEGARELDGGEGEGGAMRRSLREWAFERAPAPEVEAGEFQRASLVRQLGVEVALCYLDLRGVGGSADAQGLATARMPWASGQRTWEGEGSPALATGRWQASDGGAYRAAAQAALYRCVRARDRALSLGGASLIGVGDALGVCDVAGAPRPGWDASAAVAILAAGHLFPPAIDRWLEAALVRAAADPTTDVSVLADAARMLNDERVERVIAAGLV